MSEIEIHEIERSAPWFQYFPDSYQWSQILCMVLNFAPMGGSALWEVDQVGQRLKGREGQEAAWVDEWARMADYVLAYGEEEEKKGHALTAARAFVRSAAYLGVGERMFRPENPRKVETYRKVLATFQRGMKTLVPGFERVEVPYEEGPLPAYWIPAPGAEGKGPAVVFFDGADGTKEVTAIWGGLALRERGISCMCIDGPGQGETLRLGKIPSRYDYEVPGTAAYEYISARPEVDPARVGIMGNSMGGYYAPRIAAFEHRYAACLAWGGSFDLHATGMRRRKILESGGTISSAPMWQLPFLMGCPDVDSALEKARDFTLAEVAGKIRMPILMTHGVEDGLCPVEFVEKFHELCGSADKELKIFRLEDGATQHCMIDNLPMAADYIADWWADRLKK